MQRVNSLLSAGVTLTSTGTAVASPIPFDSSGYFPKFVRVVATGAGCYVKVGGIGVTAVSGDCMVQPLDGEILCVAGCKAISALSVSGTSSITVVPLEAGSWNYDQRTLDYAFTSLTELPSPVTFSRGSGGGAFGSDGLYRWYGYNLLTYSQDFGNAIWTKSGATISTGYADPFGGASASKLVASSGTGAKQVTYSSGGTSSGLSSKTNSVYVKAGEYTLVHITVSDNVSGDFQGVVNLVSGAVTNTVNSGTWTAQSVSAVSVGNGWWRVVATGTNATNPLAFMRINIQTTAGNDSVAGDGTSGIYIWGAQLETGSTASTYSPTTTAASGAPRFDYDPVTLAPKGLLVEEQRTNLIPNSNGFNNNGALSSATFAQNAVDPAGTTTAWTITESATSANQYGLASNSGSATLTAAVHTASAFVKAGTNTRCQLCVSSSLSTDYADFLLTGSGSVTAATTLANCSIVSLGGGWYRLSMVFTSAAATGSTIVGHINTATDTRLPVYLGTSRTLIAYGCQIELGAFPTSYIPTTTASATRSADSASMTGTNLTSWMNQTAGTIVVEYEGTPSASGPIFNAGAAGGLNITDNDGGNTVRVSLSTVAYVDTGGTATTAGTVYKTAFSYQAGDYRSSTNGGAVQTSTNATAPVSQTTYYIGRNSAGTTNINNHIRRLTAYSPTLPSATLQALTA